MRVLYVCLDPGVAIGDPKGAAIHAMELLRALEEEGHETAVVARSLAPDFPAPRLSVATGAQLGLTWVPWRNLRRDLAELATARRLAGAVRDAVARFAPDVIYERHSLFHGEGAREARRAGLPLVLEVNAPLAEEQRAFRTLVLRRLAARIERRTWRAADLVVCPSEALAERVREAGQERVLTVPNGVDPELFAGGRANGAREELGVDGRFVVGYAGSLKRWHDLETVVAAVARLPGELAPVMLVIGDGPERQHVVATATRTGVDLRLTGSVAHAELARYLSAADACVAPLAPDPAFHYFSPLKAVEYLAAERPTVVAAAGELAGLADRGATLAYRPGDATDLARALASLAQEAELRTRLVRRGREVVAARTWRGAARTIVDAASAIPRA